MHLQQQPSSSSGGCNRAVGSFVWLTNALIFYAAHKTIVVYDVERRQSLATLLGHVGIVTCIDGIRVGRGQPGEDTDARSERFWLISGAADGAVICWDVWIDAGGRCHTNVLAGVETAGPVTGVCVSRSGGDTRDRDGAGELHRPEDEVLVAVSSSDCGGAVQVLGCSADGLCLRQTIEVGVLVQCVCLVEDTCSPSSLILAGGFVDGSVRLWGIDNARPGTTIASATPCVLRHQHQNWVRAIDICWDAARNRMVMATASQDRYVRVWGFSDHCIGNGTGLKRLDAFAPKPHLRLGTRTVTVACEALLAGHEDWVHGVRFHKEHNTGDLTLLSSSMDRTMMLWRREAEGDTVVEAVEAVEAVDSAAQVEDNSLWQSVSVVGDAGINHLGYYTCAWRPDGGAIATHGHSGALHLWDRIRNEDGDESVSGTMYNDYYLPRTPACCFGHMAPVVDLSWSPNGKVLCTVSADQTCRLWMNEEMLNDQDKKNAPGHHHCWREVGRPQVHGHDFTCVAFVSNDLYVSGSEEKVLRVFSDSITNERGVRVRVKLPALGLSNVVCADTEDGTGNNQTSGGVEKDDTYDDKNDVNNQHASITEEDLSQNTLWPEVCKLYGHGNDLYRVTADPKGRYIASSSRAQEQTSAAVIIWDVNTWTEVSRNVGHDLTVTCMDCSPSGNLLATVGRDRKLIVWALNEKHDGDLSHWNILTLKHKAHARIIWGCSWMDESTLVTCARDGTISVWDVSLGDGCVDDRDPEHDPVLKKAEIKLGSSVMSVAAQDRGSNIIAAGLESGEVVMLQVFNVGGETRLEVMCACDTAAYHAGAVRRVAFCPEEAGLVCSAGDDGAVKFWKVWRS